MRKIQGSSPSQNGRLSLGRESWTVKKRVSSRLLLLLCLALSLTCVSCATKEYGVPDGMKNATAAGAEFRLYVPSVWNVSTAYGVSGAYFTMTQQSTVSAVKYPVSEELETQMAALDLKGSARLSWFWEQECKSAVEAIALGGNVTAVEEETTATTLGTLNAQRYHLTATVKGETLHVVHVLAEKANAFYVITFTVADDLYATLVSHIESILTNFIFAEAYVPSTYVKPIDPDADAPEGMKLASNGDVAYRFYVPADWTVNGDEAIYAAYLESDRTNVSVVPYMPDADSMSVAEFFALCEDMMKSTAGRDGYELLKTETEQDLGGRLATAYTYRYTLDGKDFYYKQVVAAYKSCIYSMTYTAASAELFDAHLADFERMVDAFEFR